MKHRRAWLLSIATLLSLVGVAAAQRPIPKVPEAARPQPGSLPATPVALRQFRGTLTGVVESVRRDSDFTGFVMKVGGATADPGAPPVDARAAANSRVAVAIGADSDGGAPTPELLQMLALLSPGQSAWAKVRADGPRHLLFARRILPAGGPQPGAATIPPALPPESGSNVDLRRMAAQLAQLRLELTRLQRDVAELRVMAKDLNQRLPHRTTAAGQ